MRYTPRITKITCQIVFFTHFFSTLPDDEKEKAKKDDSSDDEKEKAPKEDSSDDEKEKAKKDSSDDEKEKAKKDSSDEEGTFGFVWQHPVQALAWAYTT